MEIFGRTLWNDWSHTSSTRKTKSHCPLLHDAAPAHVPNPATQVAEGQGRRNGNGLPYEQNCEIREQASMKVTYDPKTDTLTVILMDNVPVAESDEEKPGVILDYDEEGNLISLEILDASRRVTETRKIEFQTA
jgi:uncharacterized protein YuzE